MNARTPDTMQLSVALKIGAAQASPKCPFPIGHMHEEVQTKRESLHCALHCALLLDYVPPEEPPSKPLGNALRIR